jgi:hypothetical protein
MPVTFPAADDRFPPLEESEKPLDDAAELAFRQCPPAFLQDGIPTTQLFHESTGDGGKLSAARSKKVSPKFAYEERLAAGGRTAGTYGVSVGEVLREGSRVVDDSATPGSITKPTGHVFLELRHFSTRLQRRRFANSMRNFALARGRLWPLAVSGNGRRDRVAGVDDSGAGGAANAHGQPSRIDRSGWHRGSDPIDGHSAPTDHR